MVLLGGRSVSPGHGRCDIGPRFWPKNEEGIRCPMGYAVATIDPQTMTVTQIARGPRTPAFTGTAMAALVDNELWLGSFLADRLAYRAIK